MSKIMNVRNVVIGSILAFGANVAFAAGELQAAATATQTEVLSNAGIAVAAGFAVLTVVLGYSSGFSLLKSFISKGARG